MISSMGANLLISGLCLMTLNQLMLATITSAQQLTDQPAAFAAASNNLVLDGANNLLHGQQQAMPGYYEFEVAPKMEPPSVKRQQYKRGTQICPGSNPFAAFSPKDTLCGNLNEGRVPINPLGQNINDQSYPFELIKNKTLQFLARALPVLKLEYETIPKVARYLPSAGSTNQLLNPTHMSSPFGHEHFHRLNQRLAADGHYPPSLPSPLLANQPGAGRRRRKRSPVEASYTVTAELAPSASLLVSSAHSPPGRIRDYGHDSFSSQLQQQLITKDGYRPVSHPQTSFRPNNSSLKTAAEQNNNNSSSSSPHTRQSASSLSQQQPQQNKVGGPVQPQQHRPAVAGSTPAAAAPITTPSTTTSAPSATTAAQQPISGNSQQQRNHAKATTADSGQGAAASHQMATAVDAAAASAIAHRSAGDHQQHHTTKSPGSSSNSTPSQAPSSGLSKRRSLMSCSDSANGFSSAICQAASALIEGNERQQPAWLQVVKHLGTALVGPTETGSTASTAPQVSPLFSPNSQIWSLLTGLSAITQAYGGANEAQSKSAGGGQQSSSSRPNLFSLIGQLSSLMTSSGNGGISRSSTSKESRTNNGTAEPTHKAADLPMTPSSTSLSSTLTKLALAGWASNAFAGLLDYFAPSLFSSAARGFSRRKKPYDPLEQYVDTPASLALTAAAAASAPGQQQQQQPQARQAGGLSMSKQPPTPCPSVEEYISPTFARNYQGTWKYVIQIPHEGYFTQTIQRTSCVRQRCEFTDGVCHESPRWVSLLVAEIYYPHAVFSQPAAGDQSASSLLNNMQQQQQQQQQPSLMSASPSMSSIQQVQPGQPRGQGSLSIASQDPLQMTDSLQNYNHNLNSAFIKAAYGSGLDPTNVANMQQLANEYSYQILQRDGLLPTQHQSQPLESRSSTSSPNTNPLLDLASTQQYSIQSPANQQQQNLQQQQMQQQQQQQAYQDYIMSLAAATLQQNPQMTMQDIYTSLKQSLSRRKRDLGRENSWAPQQPNGGHRIQQRSSTSVNNNNNIDQSAAINHPALNEITSSSLAAANQPFGAKPSNPILMDSSSLSQLTSDSPTPANTASAAANLPPSQTSGSGAESASGSTDQTECDGHDKIGCYVVRVYYDWFLVNGSCKCWKTTSGQQQSAANQQSGNSFLRRIFTG